MGTNPNNPALPVTVSSVQESVENLQNFVVAELEHRSINILGTVNPTLNSGVQAPLGSFYIDSIPNPPAVYVKIAGSPTSWQLVGSSNGSGATIISTAVSYNIGGSSPDFPTMMAAVEFIRDLIVVDGGSVTLVECRASVSEQYYIVGLYAPWLTIRTSPSLAAVDLVFSSTGYSVLPSGAYSITANGKTYQFSFINCVLNIAGTWVYNTTSLFRSIIGSIGGNISVLVGSSITHTQYTTSGVDVYGGRLFFDGLLLAANTSSTAPGISAHPGSDVIVGMNAQVQAGNPLVASGGKLTCVANIISALGGYLMSLQGGELILDFGAAEVFSGTYCNNGLFFAETGGIIRASSAFQVSSWSGSQVYGMVAIDGGVIEWAGNCPPPIAGMILAYANNGGRIYNSTSPFQGAKTAATAGHVQTGGIILFTTDPTPIWNSGFNVAPNLISVNGLITSPGNNPNITQWNMANYVTPLGASTTNIVGVTNSGKGSQLTLSISGTPISVPAGSLNYSAVAVGANSNIPVDGNTYWIEATVPTTVATDNFAGIMYIFANSSATFADIKTYLSTMESGSPTIGSSIKSLYAVFIEPGLYVVGEMVLPAVPPSAVITIPPTAGSSVFVGINTGSGAVSVVENSDALLTGSAPFSLSSLPAGDSIQVVFSALFTAATPVIASGLSANLSETPSLSLFPACGFPAGTASPISLPSGATEGSIYEVTAGGVYGNNPMTVAGDIVEVATATTALDTLIITRVNPVNVPTSLPITTEINSIVSAAISANNTAHPVPTNLNYLDPIANFLNLGIVYDPYAYNNYSATPLTGDSFLITQTGISGVPSTFPVGSIAVGYTNSSGVSSWLNYLPKIGDEFLLVSKSNNFPYAYGMEPVRIRCVGTSTYPPTVYPMGTNYSLPLNSFNECYTKKFPPPIDNFTQTLLNMLSNIETDLISLSGAAFYWGIGESNQISMTGLYTVATLPPNAVSGMRATVFDAVSPTFMGTLTGGGTTICPVFYSGVLSAWLAG